MVTTAAGGVRPVLRDRPATDVPVQSLSGRPSTRWLVTTPRVAVLGVTAVAAISACVRSGSAVAGVVLVASLVLGLPHGAVDLARLDGTWRRRAPVAGFYLVLAAAAAGAWLLDPLVTLLALLALSVVHFGSADVELADRLGSAPPRWWQRTAVIVAGGGVPVLVPLGLHGTAVIDVLDGLTDGHGTVVVQICRALLPVVALAVAAVALDGVRHRCWTHAVDVAVLLTVFVCSSPLLAFAAYFGLWHAWRQTGLLIDADARVLGVRPWSAAVRLLRQAALPSLISLALVVGLVLSGGPTVLVWSLAAVLCLTVPHAALSAMASRRLDISSTDGRRLPWFPTQRTRPRPES